MSVLWDGVDFWIGLATIKPPLSLTESVVILSCSLVVSEWTTIVFGMFLTGFGFAGQQSNCR